MAWNEPGGSGSKDPWGNNSGGGSKQGPPDLDEIVKKLQNKLNSLFGSGSGSSSGGGSGGGSGLTARGINKIAGLVAVVAFLVWALSGLYQVEEGKRTVILQFGAYKTTMLPGLHWYPRFIQSREEVDISKVRTVEVGYRSGGGRSQSTTSVERESLMLTQDENIIDVELAVQYKVSSAKEYLFNVRTPDLTLHQATESAVREQIGKSKMDFVLTEGRGEIGGDIMLKIQEILDVYKTGLIVTSVNMQNAQPPDQVQHAFDDAVKALQDEDRVKNEAEAYSNDIIPRARGASARILEESNAYKAQVIAQAEGEASRFTQILKEYEKAPRVTRERLYLDAVESVMSNTSKVMIDVEGGNNLLYLPLDRLAASAGVRARTDDTPDAITRQIDESTRTRLSDRKSRDDARSRRSTR
ncbi:MAG: FtsH protease activity modulator HflK [Gammaproteobacteria bacterium]|nr:FtsH protease activity modulator HflK [Gammaproteobacteria bacterium]